MTSNLRAIALAAAFTGVASMASAVTIDAFDTPLTAGDSTNGGAEAGQFEDFGMTSLSFEAAGALRAEVTFTINPFLTDLAGNPTNSIAVSYSVNGGAMSALAITSVNVGVGTIGAGGLAFNLDDGDTVSFFVTGTAGQSGNLVDFVVETSAVPLAPAGALALTGLAALGAARRRKAA